MAIPDYNQLSISNFLPSTMKRGDNSVILSVVETYENFIEGYYNFWIALYKSTDPMLIDESLLDWLAMETGNPWRNLWDRDWQVDAKRKILRDSYVIFSKRLFPETITLLFNDFSLLSSLRPKTGFILGTASPPATNLPATLGTSILDYEVVVPQRYYIGSIEYNLTRFIIDNFGMPGKIDIVFSP